MGALPEYTQALQEALALDETSRLNRFQAEVKVGNTMGGDVEDHEKNPGTILPGVTLSDAVWASLSASTKKAIWEHVRILSICCFMEAGFSDGAKPEWMEEAMREMKEKLEKVDFSSIIKKFMTFFQPSTGDEKSPDLKSIFENGFPRLPERFMKGQIARLAQEIIKDIKPDDLGITPEMMKECEKDPSRAFQILVSTFSNQPDIIQKTIAKIGKRLQQKVQSGAIRPQEIAREAEELMKEFASNTSFVDMMSGLKSAFGMDAEDEAEIARATGNDGNARLSIARDRLRKKLEKKKQGKK